MIVKPTLTDKDIAQHIIPHELQVLHRFSKDTGAIREMARQEVASLAGVQDDDDFDHQARKVLILLAMLDHLDDRRSVGMIADYFDF